MGADSKQASIHAMDGATSWAKTIRSGINDVKQFFARLAHLAVTGIIKDVDEYIGSTLHRVANMIRTIDAASLKDNNTIIIENHFKVDKTVA